MELAAAPDTGGFERNKAADTEWDGDGAGQGISHGRSAQLGSLMG